MQELKAAADKIRRLEIQGATNIASFAVTSLVQFSKRISSLPTSEIWKHLLEAERILSNARSTEPALRNGMMYILGKIRQDQERGIVEDIPQMVEIYGTEYEKLLKDAKRKIAKFGARLIPANADRFIIQTHCHSSIVEAILLEAAKQGKKFEVIATETRPFYQGRITARRLMEAGIKVTMVVDSAMRWCAKRYHANLAIVGADAVTSEGTVLNKIGSRLLALVCREEHIPLYVATPLFKYNPGTAFGVFEQIEMRDPHEIVKDWTDFPPELSDKLTVLNPAFETVNRLYINGLITETGIFPSGEIHSTFRHAYRFIHDAYQVIESEEQRLHVEEPENSKPDE